jgi:hypothetical protein
MATFSLIFAKLPLASETSSHCCAQILVEVDLGSLLPEWLLTTLEDEDGRVGVFLDLWTSRRKKVWSEPKWPPTPLFK